MSPELPLPAWANQPCERVARLEENQLPALAEDQAAAEAQLRERAFWMPHDQAQEGVITRTCRQRNEAAGIIAGHNQIVRDD